MPGSCLVRGDGCRALPAVALDVPLQQVKAQLGGKAGPTTEPTPTGAWTVWAAAQAVQPSLRSRGFTPRLKSGFRDPRPLLRAGASGSPCRAGSIAPHLRPAPDVSGLAEVRTSTRRPRPQVPMRSSAMALLPNALAWSAPLIHATPTLRTGWLYALRSDVGNLARTAVVCAIHAGLSQARPAPMHRPHG